MDPDRWKQVEELYHAALEREGSQGAAFLEQACAGDEALRGRVESLLAHYARASSRFLEEPALEVTAKALAEDQDEEATSGRHVGPWRDQAAAAAHERQDGLSLPGAGGAGRRWHGNGVLGRRPQVGPSGGDEVPARGFSGRLGGAGAL